MVTGTMILVVTILLVPGCIGIYNNLVGLRNNRENAFANIDVQLKQCADLIPQLTGAVRGYAEHEKQVLQRITEARAMGVGATTTNEKMKADNTLTQILASLRVSLEAYPKLKANQSFIQLQNETVDIENKFSTVRCHFNTATHELNNAVQTFSSNLLVNMFDFKREPMYEIVPERCAEVEKAPEVKF